MTRDRGVLELYFSVCFMYVSFRDGTVVDS